jgi:hypothetical protein
MEDSDFMDELFSRINQLEKENTELESELKILQSELEKKEIKNLVADDNDEDMEKEILEEIRQRNQDHSYLRIVKSQDQVQEITLEYIPFDDFSNLFIAADFTKWEKQSMNKSEGKFTYTTILMKGYQYSYCFYYNDEILIDFNTTYVENPKTGMLNNIVIVPRIQQSQESNSSEAMIVDSESNLANPEIFDAEKDYEKLEQLRNDYHKVSIGNEDEYEIFEKIVNFSNFLKGHYDQISISKENKMNFTRNFYNEKIGKLNLLVDEKFKNINNIFQGRIISFVSENTLYKIQNINIKAGNMKCIRLYDKNGIKVNVDYHTKSNYFENLEISSLNFQRKAFIYSKEDSEQILAEYGSDSRKDSVLKIYYQLLNPFNAFNSYNEMGGEAHPDPNQDNNQKELIPYKIVPEWVDLNEYQISINSNKITDVRYKETGLLVFFEGILIKEESGTQIKGLVSSSSLKLYTALYNKDIVNILHIHLNDTSEEIAVDSVFLEKNENPEDHKHFIVDAMGKKLNYKFIFRDYKLVKVYYNLTKDFIDEPDFEEVRIKSENFVKIKGHDLYNNYFGKIRNIPVGMLARKEKDNSDIIERMKSFEPSREGYCQERHLDELPGFVDIQIMFAPDGTLLETEKDFNNSNFNFGNNNLKISIPVCKIIPLTPKEELNFQKTLLKTQMKVQNVQNENLNKIYEEFKNYENLLTPENLNSLKLDEAKNILSILEKDHQSEFSSCLEDSENLQV